MSVLQGRGVILPQEGIMFVKATDAHMCGFDKFPFELGKTFEHSGKVVQCCAAGFHCCDTLKDVDIHSPYRWDGHSRYFIVKAWGHYDSRPELQRNGDVVHKKYAFQHMEFVTELKYKTLEEVKQAMADITAGFSDWRREANLQQFDELQAAFPSALKKCTAGRAENINKRELTCMTRHGNEHGFVSFSPLHLHQLDDPDRHFDVYHCDHEPAMGLCFHDAKAYIDQLVGTMSSMPEYTMPLIWGKK